MAGRIIWNALMPLEMTRRSEDTKAEEADRVLWSNVNLALLAGVWLWSVGQ
jgi:hypothetical protein